MRSVHSLFAGVALLALAASSCSCDDPQTVGPQPQLRVELEADPQGEATYLLDFGDVTVGAREARPIDLWNVGARPLALTSEAVSEPFSLERLGERLEIGVGASETVVFAFSPLEAMEQAVESIVEIESNERDTPRRSVRLRGRGVPPMVSCEPSPLDFGTVVRGTERVLTTTCTNDLTIPLELATLGLRGNAAQYFSAALAGTGETSATIPAGGSVAIEVRFRAELSGLNEAVLMLHDANAQQMGAVPLQANAAASSLEIDPASCLQFGYVEVGGSATKLLNLKNVGTAELQVLAMSLSGGDVSAFALHTAAPIHLERGAEAEVEVEFRPGVGGRLTSFVEIATDELTVSACVSGFGGGPKLLCQPAALDFGGVAIGSPASLSYRCTNGGYAPPGEPIDPLIVRGLETDHPSFQAVILGADGSPTAPKPEGYTIGEGFTVQVTFDPKEVGYASGNVSLAINTSQEVHLTPIAGDGVELPPCDFSVIPPQLSFGVLDRGAERRLEIGVENHGEHACLISGVRLSADSSDVFRVQEVASHAIPVGGSLVIPVWFAPETYGDHAGAVEFQVSNPERREQRVQLRGRSANPCILIEPDPVDFGLVGPGCQSRDMLVTLSNVCARALTLTDVAIHETASMSSFQIRELPELPLVLEPHEYATATVRFRPVALGAYEGALRVNVAEESDGYLAGLVGEGAHDGVQTDHYFQQERPKVDVLWVIDNSSSMGYLQGRVAERLPQFLTYALAQDVDFHIGVTTTAVNNTPGVYSCGGGGQCSERGRLFPVNSREPMDPPWPRIITKRIPYDMEDVWRFNMEVGVGQGNESPLEAARLAISPPLSTSAKDPRPDKLGHESWLDGNLGFLRDDAHLSIIMVTDQMDHSALSPSEYLSYYRQVKKPQFRDTIKVHAITVPHSNMPIPSCSQYHERGDRVLAVVTATKGEWFNICTPTTNVEAWNAALERMSKATFDISVRYVLRGAPASSDGGVGAVTAADLEVYVDGERVLPKKNGADVWRYDPVGNAIDFTPLYTPAPGSTISVTYRVACLSN